MRDVVFVHSILHYGSTEHYLRNLFERIDPARFRVTLLAPRHPVLAPLCQLPQIEHAPIGVDEMHSVPALRRELRRLRPDLVHCSDVDPPAMLAARLAGVRRVVVTHHTPELRPADSARGRALRRLAWETRPHVIFTSDYDRATGLERGPIDFARSVVIPLGIDLDRFAPRRADGRLRRELGLPDRAPLVGSVGLLKAQKAHEVLIEAAAEIDAAFVVCGEGERRQELERLVGARGLGERFTFLGHRDDVPELLAELDVFALSSDFEGMCLAVAEALAAGTPVVATAVGGVPQTVVDRETGLLVPPRDAHALAAGIRWMLEHRDEAAALARAGQERVRRLYPLDLMVCATSDLYERLLAQ